MKGHKNNSGKQQRKSHSCNTVIMQHIPKTLPKIIRRTIVSEETQGSTRQWAEEANYKSEALGPELH